MGAVAIFRVVMPGQKREARFRADDPGIHHPSKEFFAKRMDCRVEPGNDGLQLQQRKALAMSAPLQIGLVIFPKVTQLDLTGPVQVFSSVPDAKVHLIWKRIEPVPTDSVLTLTPTTTFADCPQLDVICVPGGAGTDDMVNDEEMLDFLRRQAAHAKYITSVCTGSLVLGAAGLLSGYRATTHWTAMDLLARFGATPAKTRVCVDRNRVTGGGVTAGIDFALTLVSIMVDRQTAELIQLRLEYNPAPPFNSGSPDTAPPEVLALMKEKIAPFRQRRLDATSRAAARLA
jgi:cyclohexyl-isocyanide hydratase